MAVTILNLSRGTAFVAADREWRAGIRAANLLKLKKEHYVRNYMHRGAGASALAVAFMLLSVSFARADAGKIAQVKNVSGNVKVVRAGANLTTKAGDFLYEKDTIQTGPDGSVGITFTDNTTMSTGPNSEVSLDQYQFDSSNFHGSMLADMRKGTLTMASGDIARSTPGAMKVRTPRATLAVRGTRFVVQVNGEQ
jgi:hypothetical protein